MKTKIFMRTVYADSGVDKTFGTEKEILMKILVIINSLFWLPNIFFGDCHDIEINKIC